MKNCKKCNDEKDLIIDHITFVLTEECNLSCDYCFEAKKNIHYKMSFDVFKRSIELLFRKKVLNKSIFFFGGEPLICLDDIMKWAKWLNDYYPAMKKSITTNGILLDKEILKELINQNISILLSIDGYGEEANYSRKDHQNICIWNKWLENIEPIDNKQILTIRMTVTKKNVRFLFQSVKEFVCMGICNIALAIDYYENWTEADLILYKIQFRKILGYYYQQFINDYSVHIDVIDRIIMSGLSKIYSRCRIITDSLTVLPDGDLKICHRANSICSNIYYDYEKIKKDLWTQKTGMKGIKECNECVLNKRCFLCPFSMHYFDPMKCDIVCEINQFHITEVDNMITMLYSSGNKFFYNYFWNKDIKSEE